MFEQVPVLGQVHRSAGILNGTRNHILAGFAQASPTLDLDGSDAALPCPAIVDTTGIEHVD